MNFLLGFVISLTFTFLGGGLVFEILYSMCPSIWLWLLGLPILGYWLGQATRNQAESGLLWGFVSLPLVFFLPELPYLPMRMLTGSCGNGRREAWVMASALLACTPAVLGQLRYFLRRRYQSRVPTH